MESTFRTMTVEHLGPDAEDYDLQQFVRACERLLDCPSFSGDESAITDYVFNHGSIRWDTDWCIYCGNAVNDATLLPDKWEPVWEALEREHGEDCQWVATRAHTTFPERSQRVYGR